jgi:TRAP-type C4-dicarboxylate transport system permease large subunit
MSKNQVSIKNIFFSNKSAGYVMFAFVVCVLGLIMGKENYVAFQRMTTFDTRKEWYLEAMFDYGLPIGIALCVVYWVVKYQQLKSKKLTIYETYK